MAEGVIDIEGLLAPLASGEGGVGEDLRTDFSPASPYQKLRDARAEARAEERAQDTAGEEEVVTPTAWREVKRLGLFCLGEKTKDFEIASWLAEAMVRLDGLPGLTDAARLIEGLADRYWEHGFPQPDDDGMESRASPLGGLAGGEVDGTLMQPLRRAPLFRRPNGKPVGLHLWKTAEDVAAITDAARKKARLAAGVPDLVALENEARSGLRDLRPMAVAAHNARTAWTAMAEKLDARFGIDGPSTRRVTEALTMMVDIGVRVGGPLPAESAAPEADVEGPVAEAEQPFVAVATGGSPASARSLRTRDDAIRQLEELAAWFRKTEPHSPMSYTLHDAVRRARMTLPELLAEVLTNVDARTAMLNTLGIRGAEPPPA